MCTRYFSTQGPQILTDVYIEPIVHHERVVRTVSEQYANLRPQMRKVWHFAGFCGILVQLILPDRTFAASALGSTFDMESRRHRTRGNTTASWKSAPNDCQARHEVLPIVQDSEAEMHSRDARMSTLCPVCFCRPILATR